MAPSHPPGILRAFPIDLGGHIGVVEITEISGGREMNGEEERELVELFDAIDTENYRIEMSGTTQIEDEILWLDATTNLGRTTFFAIDEEDRHRRRAYVYRNLITGPRMPWHIASALNQFEEDWEYEQWINSREYIDSLKGYNHHRLLAWDRGEDHPQWVGESVEEERQPYNKLGSIWRRERYRMDVEIITHHPRDKKGYAKGTTPYGDVYIPFKFWKYLPSIGDTTEMTIALQDVGDKGRKGNGFRWTAIYQHDPTYR